MKCRECQDWIQQGLDEGRLIVPPQLGEHLRECDSCRRDVAAARALLEGLTRLARPEATRLMTASITAAIVEDRAARRRRSTYRLHATATLAASLVLLIGFGYLAPFSRTTKVVVVERPEAKKSAAQFARKADDAQKAVASLTRSVTESTRSRVNVFLPDPAALDVRLPPLPEFDEPLDPAAQSLKLAGLSVAHTLDPIAHTTARAFDYFAREMPVFDFSKN